MARFKYIGEYPEGRESITMYDVTFAPDLVAEVADPWAVERFSCNRFFVRMDEQPAPEPAVTPSSTLQEPEPAPEPAPEPNERDELRRYAATLGIAVDGRWSVRKLARVIAEAESPDNGENS